MHEGTSKVITCATSQLHEGACHTQSVSGRKSLASRRLQIRCNGGHNYAQLFAGEDCVITRDFGGMICTEYSVTDALYAIANGSGV